MFISAALYRPRDQHRCGRYRLDQLIERFALAKAEITAACRRKQAIHLKWRAMIRSAEGACDCNDHLAERGRPDPISRPSLATPFCLKHCQWKGQSSLRYLAAALLPGQDLAAQGIEPEAV
jgi:hypothetical protein